MFIWVCQWSKWGHGEWVQRGVGVICGEGGVPWQLQRSAEGQKARGRKCVLVYDGESPPMGTSAVTHEVGQ